MTIDKMISRIDALTRLSWKTRPSYFERGHPIGVCEIAGRWVYFLTKEQSATAYENPRARCMMTFSSMQSLLDKIDRAAVILHRARNEKNHA